MAGEDRMAPLERLLNLVGLLLETRTPLTFEQIRQTLEPYGQEKVDSAKRMFERDKDILRDYGVPLELVDTDAWGTEQGYVIPKEKYYLPEISFSPEELGALLVAAQGVQNDTPAEEAVRKLMVGVEGGVLAGLAGGPLASGSDARGSLVMEVAAAAQVHRRVRFGYRTSQGNASDRDVDVYTALFRTGHWYLVGFDHERDEARSFRLSRFTTDLTDVGEGGEPPDGFRAADLVQAGPWVASGEERATIALSPEVAWWATSSLVGAEPIRTRDDGWVEVSLPVADERELAPLILQLGPDAVVVAPSTLRDEVVARLEALVG
ncbi:MAG: helix-turn-helix transcriptional regulator [Actinomycetota bacterium]